MKVIKEIQFEDERGLIQDLLIGKAIDGVTRITFSQGAVRANHFHKFTTQWTYVTKGVVQYAYQPLGEDINVEELSAGDFVESLPNQVHAFKALEEAEILVFTKGPRAGFDYERDTFRLSKKILE